MSKKQTRSSKVTSKTFIIVVFSVLILGVVVWFLLASVDKMRLEDKKRYDEAAKLIMSDKFVGVHDKETAIRFMQEYNRGGAEPAISVYRDKIKDADSDESRQFLAYDLEIVSDHIKNREVEIASIKIKADALKDFETLYAASRQLARLGDEDGAKRYLAEIRKVVDDRVYKIVSDDIETTIREGR